MPAHARRIKLRRKDLRQPDEFHTLTNQAVAWFDAHRELALGIGVVLLVVAIAALAIGRWRESEATAAADAFRSARTSFEAGKFPDAAGAFAQVATDHPHAAFGKLAILYRGHALLRSGDAAAAKAAYEEYLDTAPSAVYLRQEALDGLARARESAGDAAGALDAYTQAGALEGPFQVDALLGAARLQDAAGRSDAAREIYERLLKQATDPELRALLVSKLPPGTTADAPPAAVPAE